MKNIGTTFRMLLILAVLVAMVAGGRALIIRKRRTLAEAPRYHAPATLVRTASVSRGDLDETHDYLAVVEPVRSARVAARITATVETVAVDEGDRVERGQSLLTLDRRQIDAQRMAVQAQIGQVQAELMGNMATVASLEQSLVYWGREAERDSHLAKRETIPQAQAEATVEKKNDSAGRLNAARQKSAAIDAQVRALEARLAELEITRSYCNIISPFDGVVTAREVDPGDQAVPGKTLIVVESAGALMITFAVPQADLPAMQPGLAVVFQSGGQPRRAAITRLHPSFNRARFLRAEAVLDETQAAGLTLGEYLTAQVVLHQHQNQPLVPARALIEGADGGGQVRVFVVEDGVLRLRRVRVLGMACEQAAVEGLHAGEAVVVDSLLGWARLADGGKVEVWR